MKCWQKGKRYVKKDSNQNRGVISDEERLVCGSHLNRFLKTATPSITAITTIHLRHLLILGIPIEIMNADRVKVNAVFETFFGHFSNTVFFDKNKSF